MLLKNDYLFANAKNQMNIPIIKHPQIKIGFKKYLAVHSIVCLVADINYTRFYMQDGTSVLVPHTIKSYEEKLFQYPFFRSHRSFIVNLNFVDRFDEELSSLFLVNKQIALVSRRRINEVRGLFLASN